MTQLLALHAVRVRGSATTEQVAARANLDASTAEEMLLDFEAYGWVRRYSALGLRGWAMTDSGREKGEALLADEVREHAAEECVTRAFRSFLLLNEQFLSAITAWQVDVQSDALIDDLRLIVRSCRPVLDMLAGCLGRFASYRPRLDLALSMALIGRDEWVDGLDVDSLHRVWFELHEDLLATLGLQR